MSKKPIKPYRQFFWLPFVVLAVLTGACAPSSVKTMAVFGETLSFVPDSNDKEIFIYRNPRLKITSYSKFLIDPVTMVSDQYAGNRGIKPQEKAALSDEFRNELIKVLKDGYPIVDTAGPGVLRIRAAIRDIHPAHWELDEDKFVVIKFDTTLESAAMELDCLDSVSGERVVALVHTLKGPRYMAQENLTRLGNIRDAFGAWTRALRQRFDEAKSKSSAELPGLQK